MMGEFTFGKKEANTIKTIAILMMIFHHLFGFPDWIVEKNMYCEFTIGNFHLIQILAIYCKVTVGLFIFTTGYSLAIDEEKKCSYKYIVSRLFAFFKKYWCIFALTLFIGSIINEPLPGIKTIVLQCFGLCTATGVGLPNTTIHCNFAWYVSTYIVFLFLFPLIKRLYNRGLVFGIVVSFVSIAVGITCLIQLTEMNYIIAPILSRFRVYGFLGLLGYAFNRYCVFENIDKRFIRMSPWRQNFPLLLVLIATLVLRTLYADISMDMIITPFVVYVFTKFTIQIKSSVFDTLVSTISKHSINLWFLHSLFFTPKNTLQYIAYFPKYPLLIFVWTLLICLALSFCIEKIKSILFLYSYRSLLHYKIKINSSHK